MTIIDETSPAPAVVDRDSWLREPEALLGREQAHTHEGDAIAAAQPIKGQREGRAATIWDVQDASYPNARGAEAMMRSMAIADMTAYGRREAWEDSPSGWPQSPAFSA